MSNTITPSEDKVYMTDDLADRLSEDDLAGKVVHDEGPEPEDGPYAGESWSVPPPEPPRALERVRLEFVFTSSNGEENTESVTGDLRSISFGKGWLVSMETEEDVMPIVIKAAGFSILFVRVQTAGVQYLLRGEVDCTASFVPGGSSLTVTADEASYV